MFIFGRLHPSFFPIFLRPPPPPPLTNASPAMRLLLATQKDLIIRVECCISGSNVPTLVLVTYAQLVIVRCKELLDKVLHEPASDAV